MEYTFKTQGVCAAKIDFEVDGDIVKNVRFTGGCNGNLKAISKLLEGADADYVVEKLLGNECGTRGTSCADQLAKAIRAAQANA